MIRSFRCPDTERLFQRESVRRSKAIERLARYFKTTPQFWMNMQLHYELQVAEDELADKVERDVQPLEIAGTR